MNPRKENIELDDLEKAATVFASNFIDEGNYPDEVSDIDISLYSIPGRDVL